MSNFKNLETFAQQVWAEKELNSKREKLLAMIESFRFKGKQQQLAEEVQAMRNMVKMDQLAANLILLESGDKVIPL